MRHVVARGIMRYTEGGKSATGILRNGDAELTLILTLFRITILQSTRRRFSAFRILPLPSCGVPA